VLRTSNSYLDGERRVPERFFMRVCADLRSVINHTRVASYLLNDKELLQVREHSYLWSAADPTLPSPLSWYGPLTTRRCCSCC